jgi:hypothetical protein
MLLSYHLTFLISSIAMLLIILYVMFFMEEKRWSILVSNILIGLNIIINTICILGFHGIDVIALDSTDTFQIYTYANMYSLYIFNYGIMFICIILGFVSWGKHTQKFSEELNRGTIKKPTRTNNYWK